MRALILTLALTGLCAWAGERPLLVRPMQYFGMCDASGAVPVSSNLFAVASDEDNSLRLYRSDQGGPAIKVLDCNSFLGVRGKSLEADLEGAARIGDRAYWIGSHGRKKNGKDAPNRRRFFATDIRMNGGQPALTLVGKPCTSLLHELINDSRFDRFQLAQAATRAPNEPDALNIEGLSATPQGHLLIGFRNPIPDRQALLIPLLNPDEVISGKPARFGMAIQLDLSGLGIRDIAYHDGIYLIIAGSFHGGGNFRLYRWAGPGASHEQLSVEHLDDYSPEAIIIYPHKGLQEIQILSDDGTRMIDGCPCKELTDPRRQTFRSFWVAQ